MDRPRGAGRVTLGVRVSRAPSLFRMSQEHSQHGVKSTFVHARCGLLICRLRSLTEPAGGSPRGATAAPGAPRLTAFLAVRRIEPFEPDDQASRFGDEGYQ
jgi:hypothetical protein